MVSVVAETSSLFGGVEIELPRSLQAVLLHFRSGDECHILEAVQAKSLEASLAFGKLPALNKT